MKTFKNIKGIIVLLTFGYMNVPAAFAQRLADHRIVVLSHENGSYVKGYVSGSLSIRYTNDGPDTIYEGDDRLTWTLRSSAFKSYPTLPASYVVALNTPYNIPPGGSFVFEIPFDLEAEKDMNDLQVSITVSASTRSDDSGRFLRAPLMPEKIEWFANSRVNLSFHYRSATSSTPELDASKLNIWPNPARDEVHLTLPDGWAFANCAVSMHSIQGALLQSLPMSQNGSISLAHLPAGMYVLEVRNAEAVVRKKLMVLR